MLGLSLNKLSPPLSDFLLTSIANRVCSTIAAVHERGFIINDIKPDNLYMDEQGNVDIGDFGGVTRVGERFNETTQPYIPTDLYESNLAIPAVDYMCLINSILELSGVRLNAGTCLQVREIVQNVVNTRVRDSLVSIFAKF
jgi:serine/threonine protein kinase